MPAAKTRPGPLVRLATRHAVRRRLAAELAGGEGVAAVRPPDEVAALVARVSDTDIDDAAEHVGLSVPKSVLAGDAQGLLARILQFLSDHKAEILAIVQLLLPLILAL